MADVPALESKLAKMREAVAQSFPALKGLNERMFAYIESSVIADALDVGDRAPEFELKEARSDATVRLAVALEQGPVVLSFYRGQW